MAELKDERRALFGAEEDLRPAANPDHQTVDASLCCPTSGSEAPSAEARGMTALDVIALLMTPLGGLAVGGAVYWIATRPRDPRHPAE